MSSRHIKTSVLCLLAAVSLLFWATVPALGDASAPDSLEGWMSVYSDRLAVLENYLAGRGNVSAGEAREALDTLRGFETWLRQSGADDPGLRRMTAALLPTDGEVTYVLNTRSKKFHEPSCNSVSAMSANNRMDFTGTREEVIKMGYSPCGNCHP